MVHHNNGLAEILPIVPAQILVSDRLPKQIVGNGIKEDVFLLLERLCDGSLSRCL
jgi:hypothetical protein